MLYTIFDLETTGFSGTHNDVCQFTYLTIDHLLRIKHAANLYLYQPGMDWQEEAAKVHGLTRQFLSQFEGDYEKNLSHMYTVLQHGNLAGHNAIGFDVPFARDYMLRQGLPQLCPATTYDTMVLWRKHFGKRMKLGALAEGLGITTSRIEAFAKIAFGSTQEELHAHNACYDVAATALCLLKAVDHGLCDLTPCSQPLTAVSLNL